MSILCTMARLGAGALLGTCCVATFAGPASAAGGLQIDVPGDSAGFVDGATTPLITFDNLLPGDSGSATVKLRNSHSLPVALSLEAVDVLERENGCPEPESNEGDDSTCGTTEGELGPWLHLNVTRTDTGTDQVLWAGGFAELTSGVLLADSMAADDEWEVRIKVDFPVTAGNETMTDEVEFDLEWSALDDSTDPGPPGNPGDNGDNVGGDTGGNQGASPPVIGGVQDIIDTAVIAGVQATRPDADIPGVTLPFTGITVDAWLVWFAGVLTIGGGALVAWSRLPQGAVPLGRRIT